MGVATVGGRRIGQLTAFVAVWLLAGAALGQPVLAEGVAFDDVQDVADAQRGLVKRTQAINRPFSNAGLDAPGRAALGSPFATRAGSSTSAKDSYRGHEREGAYPIGVG